MTNPQADPRFPENSEATDALSDDALLREVYAVLDDAVAEDAVEEAAEEAEEIAEEAASFAYDRADSTEYDESEEDEEDEEDDEDDEDEEPEVQSPRRKLLRILLCVGLSLVLLVCITVFAADRWLHSMYERGREQLKVEAENVEIRLPTEEEPQKEKRIIVHDDGKTVKYDGHTYKFNKNLSTVLLMGIDRRDLDKDEKIGNGGQADVLMLLALNTETGEAKLLNIPRDTYTEFTLYTADNAYVGYEKHQICIAYAYGDGRETSCENTVSAVQNLLYGIPISKYLAIDLDGLSVANDAIGGVTLNSLEDLKMPDGRWISAGQEITLHGDYLERYIRARGDEVDANVLRMARQEQYVKAFARQLVQMARKDFSVVTELYNQVSPYFVSTLDLSDAVFLAQTYLDFGLNIQTYSYDGTYDLLLNARGTKYNSVYYPDEDSLFECVLDVFYIQVD